MILSKKAIDEFKTIWKKEFKEDISDEKANEKGLELLRFMKLIYKPIPKSVDLGKYKGKTKKK